MPDYRWGMKSPRNKPRLIKFIPRATKESPVTVLLRNAYGITE
jgi:hypothetical protein